MMIMPNEDGEWVHQVVGYIHSLAFSLSVIIVTSKPKSREMILKCLWKLDLPIWQKGLLVSENWAELHQNSTFRFFFRKTQLLARKIFFRKITTLGQFYGNFGREWRNKNIQRWFLLYRAIGKFKNVKLGSWADDCPSLWNMTGK